MKGARCEPGRRTEEVVLEVWVNSDLLGIKVSLARCGDRQTLCEELIERENKKLEYMFKLLFHGRYHHVTAHLFLLVACLP